MLSFSQLGSYLWHAAQLLRGSVDSGDFKHYIFGLLFYKRLCDVWDEQCDSAAPRFEIPSGYHWADLRSGSSGLGSKLNQAFASIERSNPELEGIFGGIDFDQQQRFSDALLLSLLEHFETHRLGHTQVEHDVLGRAYEYLIAKFADDSGKKGGEFYTPKTVAQLMVRCTAPEPGMSIYDPTCGSGGLLLQALNYVRSRGDESAQVRLFGQEKNLNTWSICKMNMFLHGISTSNIQLGDTLHEPAHIKSEQPPSLQEFDQVIANPPFSLKSWGADRWAEGDVYRRDIYGCPPSSFADFAFVQHMISSLRSDGVMAVVLPCGILFREKTEGQIRRRLLEADQIEAIVALPKRLFYGTGIPTCLLFVRRNKASDRKNRVLFVDATNWVITSSRNDELDPTGIQRVVDLYQNWAKQDDMARVVTQDEIAQNDFNLTVQRYVKRGFQEQELDLSAELEALESARVDRDRAEARLMEDLVTLGYEVS